MADKTREADKTDLLQETDNGLKEKRVNPDVRDSAKELRWQLKMRTDILQTILTQTGTQKIRQKIHLTMKNHVIWIRIKFVIWY